MGLSERDYTVLTASEKALLYDKAAQDYYTAGADYVLREISELPQLIKKINEVR